MLALFFPTFSKSFIFTVLLFFFVTVFLSISRFTDGIFELISVFRCSLWLRPVFWLLFCLGFVCFFRASSDFFTKDFSFYFDVYFYERLVCLLLYFCLMSTVFWSLISFVTPAGLKLLRAGLHPFSTPTDADFLIFIFRCSFDSRTVSVS